MGKTVNTGVYSYFDCSISHISREDEKLLNDIAWGFNEHSSLSLMVPPQFELHEGYGYFVLVPEGTLDDVSLNLNIILGVARVNGCTWLRLDPDGKKHDGLDVYDWN